MNNFIITSGDTDSIAFCKPDHSSFSKEEQLFLLKDLNSKFPSKIRWEHDGYFERMLVLKAKNYVTDKQGKRTIKGSALKASLKSPALKEFIGQAIDVLITKRPEKLLEIYQSYVKEICNIKDIKRWASKKSISESVLFPTRTNEKKVLEALNGIDIVQGDKVYLYFKTDDSLGIVDKWNQDHSVPRLLKALHDTLEVFETVYDPKQCLNYALKKNQKLLPSLL